MVKRSRSARLSRTAKSPKIEIRSGFGQNHLVDISMRVLINGEEREMTGSVTLADLVERLDLSSQRVAIELNRNVVRKKDWPETSVKDGDRIEVVHFVGGG